MEEEHNEAQKEHDEQMERARKELPFHKRFGLFLGGIASLTAGLYLVTGTGSEAQLIGFGVLIVIAIIAYFFGGRF